MSRALSIILAVLGAGPMTAQGLLAPGISAELADQRRQRISEVQYFIEFELQPRMTEVTGRIRAQFTLADQDQPQVPVVLDFAGKYLGQLEVNDVEQSDYAVVENHILLPANSLNPLENSFEAEFSAAVAPTGTPLTVYRDTTDGSEYYYTLLVPADAHRLFPCFDQPDLKARVTMSVIAPTGWKIVSNAEIDEQQSEGLGGGLYRSMFVETEPLSTYLVAFAAGPFTVIDRPFVGGIGDDPRRPLRIYYRGSMTPHLDATTIMSLHRDALRWLESYFGLRYPFPKLDVVLVPGFPYGGMEHAGAIFYRETSLVFDHPPTDGEEIQRSVLIYHEVSHQWFGNLVTMEWFDDLWLKEGFATYLAYSCLDAVEPERNAWLRFGQRVTRLAYEVDSTAGTTPVYQTLGNLDDAKSAYGAIVYSKAPAVLRELRERIGEESFRTGLRRFLTDHSYENAGWRDLMTALNRRTRLDLRRWSDRWILSPGMPQVRATWEVDGGEVSRFDIRQSSVQGSGGTWPLRFAMLLIGSDGQRRTIRTSSDRAVTTVRELVGQPPPVCVLLDPDGAAYGRFLLDETSRDYLLANLPAEPDPLLRSQALGGLYESVRDAETDPRDFADLLIALLPDEDDPDTQQQLLAFLSNCLLRYMTADARAPWVARITTQLLAQLEAGAPGLELQIFRFLARVGEGEGALALFRAVVNGDPPPGLTPGKRDRFLAAAALLARGHGDEPVRRVAEALAGQDIARELYEVRAATPTAEAKNDYFASYQRPDDPPEQWMQGSLGFFHWPGHEHLTLPFLERALNRVDWVKQNRRIFFMPAWLDAFINGHESDDALQVVERFLENRRLSPDVRLKTLQSIDGLRRAVAIRRRWGQ